jgi:hypothetical protein
LTWGSGKKSPISHNISIGNSVNFIKKIFQQCHSPFVIRQLSLNMQKRIHPQPRANTDTARVIIATVVAVIVFFSFAIHNGLLFASRLNSIRLDDVHVEGVVSIDKNVQVELTMSSVFVKRQYFNPNVFIAFQISFNDGSLELVSEPVFSRELDTATFTEDDKPAEMRHYVYSAERSAVTIGINEVAESLVRDTLARTCSVTGMLQMRVTVKSFMFDEPTTIPSLVQSSTWHNTVPFSQVSKLINVKCA